MLLFWTILNLVCIAVNVLGYTQTGHASHLYVAILNGFAAGLSLSGWLYHKLLLNN